MGRYTERYFYDAVGNFLTMQHEGSEPKHSGWTRTYRYAEESLLETGRVSNRLTSTQVGTGTVEPYTYDAHGSMTSMLHLPLMRWNHLDQLDASSRQVRNDGTPETTYYVYDGSGQRVRKVTENDAAPGVTPTRQKERLYLGGFEVYREYTVGGVSLERETLHVMDDRQRIALVETRTAGVEGSPVQLVRCQLANHLGSSALDLDELAQIITYEEYLPFGSTSYQGVRSRTDTSKRYRLTGQERDEESGLSYHLARYYAPWFGRWINPDPAGLRDSSNVYLYVTNNPVKLIDRTGLGAQDTETWTGYLGSYLSPDAWRRSFEQAVLDITPFVPAFEAVGAAGRGEYVDPGYEWDRTKDAVVNWITSVVSLAGAGLNPTLPVVRGSKPALAVGKEIIEVTATGTVERMASFGDNAMTIPLRQGLNEAAESTVPGTVLRAAAPRGASAAPIPGLPRIAQAQNLVADAAQASGIANLATYVDVVTYGGTTSYFGLQGGQRILNIGSNAMRRTRFGQLQEAAHELAHAQQFQRVVRQHGGNISSAWQQFGSHLPDAGVYDFDEVIAERLSIERITKYMGGVSSQQRAVSLKYAEGYREVYAPATQLP